MFCRDNYRYCGPRLLVINGIKVPQIHLKLVLGMISAVTLEFQLVHLVEIS